MTRNRSWLVFVGLMLSAISAPRTKDAVTVLDSNLQIAIQPLRAPITVGSELSVEVVVHNDGPDVARVPVALHKGLDVRALKAGVRVPSGIVIEHLPRPNEPLTDLAPGEQRSFILPNVMKQLGIVEPGQYTLVAEYWYRIWRDGSGEYISLRRPLLRSEPLEVVVGPKP